MIKENNYSSDWHKVSLETFKEINKLIDEIDEVISNKYIKLEQIEIELSKEGKRSSKELILNEKIHLLGEIKGLINSQIILNKILID